MIEVEKKFLFDETAKNRLLDGAEFIKEKTFTDIYFDTTDYNLTSQDKWLRTRDGKFELKIALVFGERLADQYDELEDEEEIKKALGFELDQDLGESLVKAGYAPFCTCITTRRKYKKGEFVIDLDSVDLGDFTYELGEIEVMVNDKPEVDAAISRILEFAKENGLKIVPVRGKVVEYLRRAKQDHYRALIDAGVFKELG